MMYPGYGKVFESRGLLHWVWRRIRKGTEKGDVQFILDEVAHKVNRVEGRIRIGEKDLLLRGFERGERSTSGSISRH